MINRKWLVKMFAAALGEQAPESKPATTVRPPKALIVEDCQEDADLLSVLLRDLGWEYEVARSPRDAFIAMDSDRFDAILVDVHFPGDMSGFQFEEELRRLEARRQRRGKTVKHIPVVFVTGLRRLMVNVHSGHCFTAIYKPVSADALAKALKQCNGITEHPEPKQRPQWQIVLVMMIFGIISVVVGHGLGQGWLLRLIHIINGSQK